MSKHTRSASSEGGKSQPRSSAGNSQFADLEFVQGSPVDSIAGVTLVVDLWTSSSSKNRFRRAVFVGVTRDRPDVARNFISDMRGEMSYRVACQSEDGNSLQRLIGVQFAKAGLPVTFVIQDGLLKWSGEPSDPRLEVMLESLGEEASGPRIDRPTAPARPAEHKRSKSQGTGGGSKNPFQRLAEDMGMVKTRESRDDTEDEDLIQHVSDLNRSHSRQQERELGVVVGRVSVRGGGGFPDLRPEPLRGTLWKRSRVGLVGWKERFFEQDGSDLLYFGYVGESRPRRRISLKTVKEVSKRTHHEMGPCIGLLTPERFFLLCPAKYGSIEKLRYWYDGLVAWQKWFEAHPNDEPERSDRYSSAKKGSTTMETISHSFVKGTKKLGKAVVGEGNLDDTSESSDEEEKKERRKKREQRNKEEEKAVAQQDDLDDGEKRAPPKEVRREPVVAEENHAAPRSGPEAEPWKHDVVPGQDEFRRAERAKTEDNEMRKRREEERRRGEEKLKRDQEEEKERKAEEVRRKKEKERMRKEEEEEEKREAEERKRQEKEEKKLRKQKQVATAEPRPEARKYDELASEREERKEREEFEKKTASDPRKEKEAHQRTVETRMTRAQELDLSMMGLTNIPADWLAGMRNVRFVDLSFNTFDSFPEDALLQQTSHCQFLVMGGCQLRSLPPSIGQFKELKELSLNGNQFTTLPAEIGQCQTLEKLFLANNQLSELPSTIGWLYKLEELHLTGNHLRTLPASVGNLCKLQVLDVSSCGLQKLPDEIVYCTQLQDLNVSQNELTALPERIGWLIRLASLNATANKLTDLPLSAGLLEGCCEIGLGIAIAMNPIVDKEMMKKSQVGADQLISYLERRMMLQSFNQRAVMVGFPERDSWPWIPMPPLKGAGRPVSMTAKRPVSQIKPTTSRPVSLALAFPIPSTTAEKPASKIDLIRNAIDAMIARDILPQVALMRDELLNSKTDATALNACGRRVMKLKPHVQQLVQCCGLNIRLPKPQFQADTEHSKKLRLTLLYTLKELETTLEGAQQTLKKNPQPVLVAEVAKSVKEIKTLIN